MAKIELANQIAAPNRSLAWEYRLSELLVLPDWYQLFLAWQTNDRGRHSILNLKTRPKSLYKRDGLRLQSVRALGGGRGQAEVGISRYLVATCLLLC